MKRTDECSQLDQLLLFDRQEASSTESNSAPSESLCSASLLPKIRGGFNAGYNTLQPRRFLLSASFFRGLIETDKFQGDAEICIAICEWAEAEMALRIARGV